MIEINANFRASQQHDCYLTYSSSVHAAVLKISFLGSFDFMCVVAKSTRSTNARLGEKARPAYFFVSPRHFDFLTCETETSKCFKYELETFRRYQVIRYKQIICRGFFLIALKKLIL